jgi:hypothetical protein
MRFCEIILSIFFLLICSNSTIAEEKVPKEIEYKFEFIKNLGFNYFNFNAMNDGLSKDGYPKLNMNLVTVGFEFFYNPKFVYQDTVNSFFDLFSYYNFKSGIGYHTSAIMDYTDKGNTKQKDEKTLKAELTKFEIFGYWEIPLLYGFHCQIIPGLSFSDLELTSTESGKINNIISNTQPVIFLGLGLNYKLFGRLYKFSGYDIQGSLNIGFRLKEYIDIHSYANLPYKSSSSFFVGGYPFPNELAFELTMSYETNIINHIIKDTK